MSGRRQLLAVFALLFLVLAVGVRVHLDASEPSAVRAPARVVAPASDGPRLEGAAPRPPLDIVSGRPKEEPAGRGEVRVRVLDPDGRPIAGAEVRVAAGGSGEASGSLLTTDAAGEAIARGLPPGEAWAYVRHREFMFEMEEVHVVAAAPAQVEVRLARRIRVRGRVTLPDGAPAPHVPIDWFAGGSAEGRTEVHRERPAFEEQARSAADGTFEVFLAPGRLVTIVARLEPYADAELALIPRATRDDVRLVLRPGGALAGVVRAPDGRPEPGAQVFVVPEGVPELLADPRSALGAGAHAEVPELDDDGIGREEGPALSTLEGPIHRAWTAGTDDQGRWQVTRLPLPGRYRVLAQGRGGARGGSEPVDASPPGSGTPIDLALTTRHSLHVRIVGEGGETLDGRCVLRGARRHFLDPACPVAEDGGGLPSRRTWSEKDEASRCTFLGLVPGTYRLEVFAPRAAPRSLPVTVLSDPETVIQVESVSSARMEVLVVDGEGRPLERASVRVKVAEGPGGPAQVADADTDAQGRASLPVGSGRGAHLQVRRNEYLPFERADVAVGVEPIRCVLAPRARLRFEVVGDEVDARLAGPWVWEVGTDAWDMGRSRHVAGRIWEYLAASPRGEALIVIRPREDRARVVVGRHKIEAGAVLDLGAVRVDAGREIAGRVLDPQGRGVPGVVVFATVPGLDDRDPDMLLEMHAPSGTTDVEGRFTIRAVQHAPALLRTAHATWAPARAPHAAGEPAPELRLSAGAWLAVTLAHAGRVDVEGPDGVVRGAEPEPGRGQRIGPLPAGAHRVRFYRAGRTGPASERTLTLAVGEEARLDG